jgi:hypothetical protein
MCTDGVKAHADAIGEVRRVDDAEFHVDRVRVLVLVFDFGLGQRRAAIQAPVDRLRALI